jgi:hypothetical protein
MFPQFYKAQLLHPSQAFHSCHSLSLGYQASLKHNPISTFSTFLLDNFSCHGANEARIGCGTTRGCHRRGQPQGAHNFHVRCCYVPQEDLLVDILLCHERCGMVMYPSSLPAELHLLVFQGLRRPNQRSYALSSEIPSRFWVSFLL